VRRLEPLCLLLGIVVRDCADAVVAPAILVDLARTLRVALDQLADMSEPDKLIYGVPVIIYVLPMIMEGARALTRLITQFPDTI
jgi:hypothetical protein